MKKQGRGPKKTKTVSVATRKENMAGVRSNSCMDAMIVRGVDMDVDREEVGNKRRCRTPLMEIEGENGNGKRVKVEGEVKELGKVLKHYLGSVEATKQPCRA